MAKSILLELLEARNYKELKRLMGEYNPVDLAELLMELNDRDLAIVFRMIEKDKAAEVFSYMDDDQRQTLLDCFTSQEIKHILISNGALGACMSGTGPTVFGLFMEADQAQAAQADLKRQYRDVFFCKPV